MKLIQERDGAQAALLTMETTYGQMRADMEKAVDRAQALKESRETVEVLRSRLINTRGVLRELGRDLSLASKIAEAGAGATE